MISFIGFSYRSSGIIRGKQLSSVIRGSDFVDVDAPTIPKNKMAIFVRKYDERFAKACKNNGMIVGFDVADNPVTDYLYGRTDNEDMSRYTSKFCDFYIVNNDVCKKKLSEVTDKKIFVIPHHSCNFSKSKIEIKEPKTMGYVGLPDYSLNDDAIKDLCKKTGLKFIASNPQKHEDLESSFLNIDIGIVFFDKNVVKQGIYERTLRYKPNTKLTNFQSFGIPTVCLPYESYKQFGNDKCFFTENFDDLVEKVNSLKLNSDLYKSLSEESIIASENYHILKLKETYLQIKREFFDE